MRASLWLSAFLALGAQAAEPPPVQRVESGNRTSENIPAIPDALVEKLARYQNTRDARFAGWLPDGSLLVSTRFGETSQAHRVRAPMAAREQLTFSDEPIAAITPRPGKRAPGFVYARDVGGSEFWQLYWYDLGTRETTLLTDGKRSQNRAPLFSRDGRWLAWSSSARNGTDFDLWVRDMDSGESRMVLARSGAWYPSDFSPDGTRLLVRLFVSINESYPGELDLGKDRLRLFPVDGGKAAFNAFRYAEDGRSVYYVSDEEREFLTLRNHNTSGRPPSLLSGKVPWDVTALDVSPDGKHLAYVSNEDGIGRLHLLSTGWHRELPLPELPVGVINAIGFSPDGGRLALSIDSATSAGDVYVVELAAGTLVRWTQSEIGGLDASRFIAPTLVRYPTFDRVGDQPRTIPAFYYRPPGDGPFPVLIDIHGGPESQALPGFSPTTQFLLQEMGVAVLRPNVRGSAGYGKSYLQLDNGLRREDSVQDIGALLDWIAAQPELDASRVGVFGGSYGGYMVLASMARYNDRLRAGVDVVGISDFRTFLANTEEYRRDFRRAEYGDERDPAMAEFLGRIAPLNNADRITHPLFVAQGLNDPRVPWTEAEQIVAAVRGNGGVVWSLVFSDEGHGFRKKGNRDYFTAASMLFLQQHLVDAP